jgi:arylsulfatase A-like enzyme
MKILVIEARGLPAGFLGCYGNEWIATPCLDRLAVDAVVFERHYAALPDLDGTEPTWQCTSLGQLHVAQAASQTSEVSKTSEVFDACATPPAAIMQVAIRNVEGFGKAARTAWRQWKGADGVLWIDGPSLAPPWSLPADLLGSYFGDDEEDDVKPWPEPPLGIHASLGIDECLRLHDTFAAVVTYFDSQLASLLEAIDEETAVCVTARSGLPLGEHGLIGQTRAWLHEDVVHVPLILRLPRAECAGLRLGALTQPLDLAPTFFELCSAPHGPGGLGRSLLPLMHQTIEAVRPYACSALSIGASAEWSLRTLDWALLLPQQVPPGDAPREPLLYKKPDDRWEINDVRQLHLDLADNLERTLRAFVEGGGAEYPPLPDMI